MVLSLRGDFIPTYGSEQIVITDINPDGDNDVDALICLSVGSITSSIQFGDWYLHPTQQTADISYRIQSTDSRGWHRNRGGVLNHRQLVRLRRDDSAASVGRALEGVFTCDIPGDIKTPVSVGIYYPSEFYMNNHI